MAPLDTLNFGEKTAKRVDWEAWEFAVTGPREVQVTNASYGYLKDDHTYTVTVRQFGDGGLPHSCECPADEYNDEYDCKHKVALATVGGPAVLDAALTMAGASKSDEQSDEPDGEPIRADGGCDCDRYDFPCFECYLSGRRALP